jgi:hypothetical protein
MNSIKKTIFHICVYTRCKRARYTTDVRREHELRLVGCMEGTCMLMCTVYVAPFMRGPQGIQKYIYVHKYSTYARTVHTSHSLFNVPLIGVQVTTPP